MKLPSLLQTSRHTIQLIVLALVVVTPLLARYANRLNAGQLNHLIERTEGSLQADALEATDTVVRGLFVPDIEVGGSMRRDDEGVVEFAQSIQGTNWSFEVFGLRFTDPLAAAESMLASRTVRKVLLFGLIAPLLLTVLLGRVFCSWLCPIGFLLEMSGKLRGLLRFLEVRPGRVKLWYGNKFIVLAIGLTMTFAVGLPLLSFIYPPAILGRELHSGIAVMFDRAEVGMVGYSAAGLTIASWFLIGIALLELGFGARIWCRSLCPGGALYAVLGKLRIVRLQRDAASCTDCGDCVVACGMGLNPMIDQTGIDCDNCGACISSCADESLGFHLPGWSKLKNAQAHSKQPSAR